ncbi:MAG TPA: hypothetical protein VKU44_10015, partial [Terriglobia bacterium]|nr:hypothetical protein [Terriglobia bacterium]
MVELRRVEAVTPAMEIERRLLQVLCQGTPPGSVRAAARASLRDYRWCDPVHQVIFEIILSLPVDSAELTRNQLPARLTRRGFPDVEIDDLFRPHGLSELEAEGLI